MLQTDTSHHTYISKIMSSKKAYFIKYYLYMCLIVFIFPWIMVRGVNNCLNLYNKKFIYKGGMGHLYFVTYFLPKHTVKIMIY